MPVLGSMQHWSLLRVLFKNLDMPFTKFEPDNIPWKRYFVEQAEAQQGKKSAKRSTLYTHAGVGGGLATGGAKLVLAKVGVVKTKHKDQDTVTVNMTSPAEATVEQAKSEMDHIIKSGDRAEAAISKQTAKRVASLPDRKAAPAKKKQKKRKTVTYHDIFS